jgi:hypothetical protein
VDDDTQVCDAYEGAGFRVLRADWMASASLPGGAAGPAGSAAVLHEAQEQSGRT